MSAIDARRLEDRLSDRGFADETAVLAVASYLGGQAIIRDYRARMAEPQEIKDDGSTAGALDLASGQAIARYINAARHLSDTQFRSEEKMPFRKVKNPSLYGIFDELDGSINPMIGGANMQYVGVGGVLHRPMGDEQVAAAAYLPIGEPGVIFLAQEGKGTHALKLDDLSIRRIELSDKPAQKNIIVESGFMTPATMAAENALYALEFYNELGAATARDKVTGGIFQAVSGIRDSRQVVLNFAASHQADYCHLLLSEAGAEVVGQNGDPMYSTSYAMLSIAPSFVGDRARLKDAFVTALIGYEGWSPGNVVMRRVCE